MRAAAARGAHLLLHRSAAQIRADGTLEPRGALAKYMAQVLEVITGRDTKLAHEILGSRLEVPIVFFDFFIGAAKVGVG